MRRNRCAFLLAAASTIGVLLPAAPSAAQTAPAPVVKNVPASIRSDGNAEVGAQLTRWLAEQQSDHAGQSLVVRFAPGGTYKINDAAVVLNRPSKLTLDFQDATLLRDTVLKQSLRYPQRHGFLRLNQPTDVTVRNLKVRGVNANHGKMNKYADGYFSPGKPYLLDQRGDRQALDTHTLKPADEWGVYSVALAFEHGVDITDGTRTVVENSDLRGMGGDGVGTVGPATHGVKIRNNIVRQNGRQGVALTAGRHFVVEGNDIVSVRAGVDIEPDKAVNPLSDIVVRNNVIKSRLLAFPSGGPGEVHRVNIHNNRIKESGVPVLSVQSNGGVHPRTEFTFENNVVEQPLHSPQPLVKFGNVHKSRVVNNTINRVATSCSRTAVAFTTRPSTGITVNGNSFGGAKPVVQDVAGGSGWSAPSNTTGSTPAPELITGNVLSHELQDFETGSRVCWQATGGSPSLARVLGGAHRGNASMKMTVPSGLTGFALPGVRTDIETGPNRTLSFRGAVKALDAAASAYVIFQPYGRVDGKGKLVPLAAAESLPVTGSAAVGRWSTFSTTTSSARTPVNTEMVRVSVGVASKAAGDEYLFDHLAAFSKP